MTDELTADIAILNTLTRAQLLRETAGAERLAVHGDETPEDLAYRAALEKLQPGLAVTDAQREGWACIRCGRTAGLDVPMAPTGNVRFGGSSWTLFACVSCPDTATLAPLRDRLPNGSQVFHTPSGRRGLVVEQPGRCAPTRVAQSWPVAHVIDFAGRPLVSVHLDGAAAAGWFTADVFEAAA